MREAARQMFGEQVGEQRPAIGVREQPVFGVEIGQDDDSGSGYLSKLNWVAPASGTYYVEVSPDMRQAKVHVSIMGDETKQQLSLRGLQNAAGFLQTKVAKRIDTRYTPRLAFVLDLGVKRSIEISQILKSVLPSEPAETEDSSDEGADDEPAPT